MQRACSTALKPRLAISFLFAVFFTVNHSEAWGDVSPTSEVRLSVDLNSTNRQQNLQIADSNSATAVTVGKNGNFGIITAEIASDAAIGWATSFWTEDFYITPIPSQTSIRITLQVTVVFRGAPEIAEDPLSLWYGDVIFFFGTPGKIATASWSFADPRYGQFFPYSLHDGWENHLLLEEGPGLFSFIGEVSVETPIIVEGESGHVSVPMIMNLVSASSGDRLEVQILQGPNLENIRLIDPVRGLIPPSSEGVRVELLNDADSELLVNAVESSVSGWSLYD